MNITLVRTKADKYTTHGEIYIGDSVYYTIEPPIITKAKLEKHTPLLRASTKLRLETTLLLALLPLRFLVRASSPLQPSVAVSL